MKDDVAPQPSTGRLFLTVFPSIMLPMFLAVVDQTIVATALPAIAAATGEVTRVSWIVVGYLIASTIAAPIYGRLGDVFGRRRLMFVALGVFIVADRLALYNLSMAFSPHEDNTAYLGLVPALVAPFAALVAGSSGAFIDRFGFPPVALVGFGAALVALALVVFRLPEPRYSHAGRRAAPSPGAEPGPPAGPYL